MKYYIADTHFQHKNILRFDNRPWYDLSAMEDDMIALWNERVKKDDDVYILGDFCWGSAEHWRRLLPKLRGKKHLILGNHDLSKIPADISRMFEGRPTGYLEIKDGEYNVILSHYPLISYKHDIDPKSIMLHGHVHNTVEAKALKEAVELYKKSCLENDYAYKGRLYNIWCGFYGWAPATLTEILLRNK